MVGGGTEKSIDEIVGTIPVSFVLYKGMGFLVVLCGLELDGI